MAIAIVQSWGSGSLTKVSTYTCTASTNPLTSGNWILYFVLASYGGSDPITASETSGNGISYGTGQVANSPQLNATAPYYVWAVPISSPGATSALTVSTGLAFGTFWTVSGVEVSGVATVASSLGTVDPSFPTTHTGVTFSGLSAGTAVIQGFCDNGSSATETYTAGLTGGLLTNATFLGSANTYDPAGVQYQLGVSGSLACGWTSSIGVTSSTIAIALLAAGTSTGEKFGMLLGVGS